MIPVTRPHLPCREKLDKYLDGIYERQWLTNNGQLVQELTHRLEEYLGVRNLLLVANGTLALQIAYRALGVNEQINGKSAQAITTPFTFIATASSLKWENILPVFADIDPLTWCLASKNIEAEITSETKAIVPVHVFGNSCDVEAIDAIAQKHRLKVIYDASHAFGVKYRNESLLNHGDASTLSFHATKLFHTGEGGAIIFKRKEDLERAKKMINFGITGPESIEELGINAKMSELQAAMGLSVLDEIEANIAARKTIWANYWTELADIVQLQHLREGLSYNAAYFPILFESEELASRVLNNLKENGVFARRYFFPSLETVDFFEQRAVKAVSNDIARRILCIPIYSNLEEFEQRIVIEMIKSSLAIERQV